MALQDTLEKLKELDMSQLDVSDFDINNIGMWPTAVKVVLWLAIFGIVLGVLYTVNLHDSYGTLQTAEDKEVSLRADFEKKVNDAANLEAYRAQMTEMEQSFDALLKQLPQDTQVPVLIDDISGKGLDSGLTFNKIDLKSEHTADYYIELPIEISVTGGYHDFGSFVSGIAGLSRIVTLDDFTIMPASGSTKAKGSTAEAEKGSLTMVIMAKTYRYKPKEQVNTTAGGKRK